MRVDILCGPLGLALGMALGMAGVLRIAFGRVARHTTRLSARGWRDWWTAP